MKPFKSMFLKLAGSLAFAALAACGGGSSSPTNATNPTPTPTPVASTGTVNGKALDAQTGQGIAAASVSYGSLTTTTAGDGTFTLALAPVSANAVIKIEKANYAIGFATTAIEQNKTASTQAVMTKVAISAPLGIASGGTVKDPNTAAQVTLPASGLVDAAGAPASGNVTVNLSVIDPRSNAAAMPGDYTTSAGTTIESFGAIKVTLLNAAGAPLNLAAGKTATIRIPVSASSTPDATIPLFYFNETTGKWVQEGTATLMGTAPNQFYEGTVTHFTYWNADKPAEIIYVNGCLKDAAGTPIANAVVKSSGIDYSNTSSATTSSAGTFKVVMKKNAKASIFAGNGSNVVIAGPSAVDVTLPTCLVTAQASAPIIVTQPVNESVAYGAYATFNVAATPTGVQYAWYKNGVAIPNANSAILYVFNGTNGDTYFVKVSNTAGTTTSQTATLTVAAAPIITITLTEQPLAVTSAVGGTATFSVLASINNLGTLTYQWRKNGVAIVGATGTSYTTPALTIADSGANYSVVVTSGTYSASSANAQLTVTPAPSQLSPVEQMRTVHAWIGLFSSATKPIEDGVSESYETIQNNSYCATGTQKVLLDGVAAVEGSALPAGSHQLSVVSNNCSNSYLFENGTSTLAYNFINQNGSVLNGSGTTTFNGLRFNVIRIDGGGSIDLTSTGSAAITYQTSKTTTGAGATSNTVYNQTYRITPAVNSTVRNNANTLVATYVSGNTLDTNARSSASTTTSYTSTDTSTTVFNALTYTVLGETYVLTGTIGDTYSYTQGNSTGTNTYTGQINLTRNGVLVGFLFADAAGIQKMNINGVITPFFQ